MRPLPFVYVFGRADFTISYFGANVYPENVTVGLEQPPISGWVTGKFVMQAREDDDRNPYLSIVVELAPGESPDHGARSRRIAESIRVQLLRLNSEFAHYVPAERQRPRSRCGQRRPRLLPRRRQTPLHAGNERPVMSQESPAHHAGGYQFRKKFASFLIPA